MRVRSSFPALFLFTIAFTALLTLVSTAHAGFWDAVKGAKDKVVQASSEAACAAKVAVVKTAAVATEVPKIAEQIVASAKKLPTLIAQLQEISCTAAQCTWSFAAVLPIEALRSAVRVYRFEGSLDDVRKEIVVPLVGHLQKLRELKASGNKEELAKAFARFTVFTIEAGLKFPKAFQEEIAVTAQNVGGLVIPQVNVSNPPLVQSLLKEFLKTYFSLVKEALFTEGLSFSQRLAVVTDETAVIERFIVDVAVALGWHDLQAEIQAWGKENTESPVAETP